MPGCAVATCRNTNRKTKGSDVRYFRFPQDEDLSKQWINVCRRNDTINLKNARICSIHFEQNSFEIPLRQRLLQYSPKNSRTLKCDAMPTLYLPGPSYTTIKKTERHTRFIKRDQQAIVADLLNKNDQLQPSTSREKPVELLGSINIDEMETNIEDVSELVIGRLQEKIKMLEEENKKLKQEVTVVEQSAFQKYEHILATVFTPGQIRKLLDSGKNRKFRWTPEDIASAVSLRSVSPKAYRYLRANKYPLPALSTLRKWVSTFDLGQGILKHVISLMKTKSAELTEVDRLCILPFDEIYISNKVDIDKKDEQVVGPHKASQTCMVRGLFSNWKQPIFYKFDQAMSKDILNEIISNLFHANFIVVAICSDMGAGNVGLWSKLDPIYLEDEVISDALINLMDSFEIKEQINMEALRYVAGYVAYRFRNKYPTLGIPTKDFTTSEGHQWLDILSRGALLSPTEELWEVTKMMETIFYQMNGSSLCKEKKIFHNLAQKTLASLPDTSVPFDVILCMCRTRVYIRLRDINRKISFQNCQRRLDRKMSKFTNFKK
nr:unnamed protein product [Callosobruchus chinensis]